MANVSNIAGDNIINISELNQGFNVSFNNLVIGGNYRWLYSTSYGGTSSASAEISFTPTGTTQSFSFNPLGSNQYPYFQDGARFYVGISDEKSSFQQTISSSALVNLSTPAKLSAFLTSDTGPISSDNYTKDARLTVSKADTGSIVSYTVDGVSSQFYNSSGLKDGAHTVSVQQTNQAGNASEPTEVSFILDTVKPIVAINSQKLTADTGLSSTDLITNNGNVTVVGTVENTNGTVVQIFDGLVDIGSATVQSNTFSFMTNLAEGRHSLYATATDLAGNSTSTSFQPTITVDTTAPAAPVVMLTNDTGISNSDHITNNSSTRITTEGVATLKTTITNDAGVEVNIIQDGSYHIKAVQTDAAGNASGAGNLDFVLDKTNPIFSEYIPSFTYSNGVLSVDKGGRVETNLGTTVHVFDGTTDLGSVPIDGQGNWKFNAQLGDGGHRIHAEAIDLAGNIKRSALSPNVSGDTVTFDFKLTDASIGDVGTSSVIFGRDGALNVNGINKFIFTDGIVNEADGSPLIDDLFYYANNLDVWKAGIDADTHYNGNGWHEGRDPNASFSTVGYLAANPDVAAAGLNPLTHYDGNGWREGRDPSDGFDNELYLAHNPDVKAAGLDPLFHYLASGQSEGREIYAAVGRGADLSVHPGFDAEYYLLSNPDVAKAALAAGGDSFAFAYQHYEGSGWHEGRNPNAVFDTKGYLNAYADVKAANIDPLAHYHNIGWTEGRDPSASFDTKGYDNANPDVAAAHVDPMLHYLQAGGIEGRTIVNDGHFG